MVTVWLDAFRCDYADRYNASNCIPMMRRLQSLIPAFPFFHVSQSISSWALY
jgi:hypothetical protein